MGPQGGFACLLGRWAAHGCALGRARPWTGPREPGPGPLFNNTSCGGCVQCWVLVYLSGACLVVPG